jgi:peptide/nickel transport system substrate-binding protein
MMRNHSRLVSLLAALALLLVACQPAAPTPTQRSPGAAPAGQAPAAQSGGLTRVVVGMTGDLIETNNPYADSSTLPYAIWCQVLGCLLSWDSNKGDFVPWLAESWKAEDSATWVFNLRRNVKWHDGSPFTSADVLHSIDRIANDPASRQKFNLSSVARLEAPDDYTVKVITKEPTADLLMVFANRLSITNKAQYEKYQDKVWEQKPVGTGPYMLKELVPAQHIILAKNPNWWGGSVQGPDEVVFRVIRDPEVRITALLNNEIQVAQQILPHMVDRVGGNANVKVISTDSVEMMFLAMNQKFPPWDNRLLRQAVVHAIDRDAIITGILQGLAVRLDGPIGPGQVGYDSALQPRYPYDPEKAKQYVAQAGFPNGLDVDLYTPVGRYVQDKQVSEAMAQMLTAVGIRTTLVTPEWATLWANVQDGKVPFYYMGRGAMDDPARALSQYFETGQSPRIGYSNPRLDALFAGQRAAFDPNERKAVLSQLMSLLTEEAPAHFLWKHKLTWGTYKNVDYSPRLDEFVYADEIRVK